MPRQSGPYSEKFLDDLSVEHRLYARIIASEQSVGGVASIDDSACQAVDGYVGLVSAEEATGLPRMGSIIHDRPVLAGPVLRHVGEPVGLVVAESLLAADLARSALEICYEDSEVPPRPIHPEGPTYTSSPDWTLESDWDEDICHSVHLRRGDVREAFDGADLVLDGEFEAPALAQSPMEPHGVVADWDGDELTIYSNCQHPFAVRAEVARIFGLSLSQVRVIVPRIGGGFGAKSWTKTEPLAVLAAMHFGRPVKLMLRSGESALTTRRHPATVSLKTAFSNQGRILGRVALITLDTGAYADNGPRVIEAAATAAIVPYSVANYDIRAVLRYSRSVPSGSMRAIGSPQVQWGTEVQLAEASRTLDMDQWDIRRLNLASPGEELIAGRRPPRACTPEVVEAVEDRWKAAVAHLASLEGRSEGSDASRAPTIDKEPLRGLGISVAMTPGGASAASTAVLRLAADASAVVLAGSSEMGQGSRTTLAQIVATELGIDVARIRIKGADTAYTPYDYSTGASRSTTVMGAAIRHACQDLIDQARTIYSRVVACRMEAVTFSEGKLRAGVDSTDLASLVALAFGTGGEIIGRGWSSKFGAGNDSTPPTRPLFWELSAAIAQVVVEPHSGVCGVERLTIVGAPGRVINRLNGVKAQEEGASIMGLGAALFEHMQDPIPGAFYYSVRGNQLPMMRDLPAHLETLSVEDFSGPGQMGERGVGECSVVAAMSAVAAACALTTGAEIRRLPVGYMHTNR